MQSMKSIDYNTWMSLMDAISSRINSVISSYPIVTNNIHVIPSYPKDLTKLQKPSIIVQKITAGSDSIGFGNVLGSYYDIDNDAIMDISGMLHEILFQINIQSSSNTETSIIESIIIDEVINASRNTDNTYNIQLMDYVTDRTNPVEIGNVIIDGDTDITYMSSNDNNDYISILRINVSVIQVVVPQQEFVDLSKGFKYNQIIKL